MQNDKIATRENNSGMRISWKLHYTESFNNNHKQASKLAS